MASQVVDDPRSTWHVARLIPTAGIKGQEEQERRATSALLAVMHAVPEFGHALLKELGAPKSTVIDTFAEVRFKDAAGKTVIPDGAIVCERGKRSWTCLVEVKTSGAPLRDEQVSAYLDVARDSGFDAVFTISNQITASSDESPITVDKRKLRKVELWHLSWWRIITEAIVQSRYRGVSDPDQAWILGELIAYLDHEASGAGGFGDMGDKWVSVRKAAHDRTLRAGTDAREVAERWGQFTQYLCLGLSQDLGRTVTAPRSRKQTTNMRLDEIVKTLVTDGLLESVLRVPDAVGDITLRADLRSRQTLTSVTLPAPNEMVPSRGSTGCCASWETHPMVCASKSRTRTPARRRPSSWVPCGRTPIACCTAPTPGASPGRSRLRARRPWVRSAARRRAPSSVRRAGTPSTSTGTSSRTSRHGSPARHAYDPIWMRMAAPTRRSPIPHPSPIRKPAR
jgi:hypothetical protein